MLVSTLALLQSARKGRYALGAFNVYNLEGVKAVVAAAEAQQSPVLLQIHPGALQHGGMPLLALCLAAARDASIPISVHLDHSTSATAIQSALTAGAPSVMADGSHLPYDENIAFTRTMARLAHAQGASIEAELGRLAGTEDDLTVHEYEAHLTDPEQAADFVSQTGADMLAICIGNVHGHYRSEPHLDFERLDAIRRAVAAPLVLHGASGLPEEQVRQAIELGICKFNVNTEVRAAYLHALQQRLSTPPAPDIVELMNNAVSAMQAVVVDKLHLFGSAGRA